MNFNKLTPTQLTVFEQIAVNNDAGHNQQTLDSLVRRGLIEEYEDSESVGLFKFTTKRYRVPILVHAAWCQWASDKLGVAK